MKAKFIVACVFGEIMAAIMVAVNVNNVGIGSLIGAGAIGVVFFPFAMMSFILNFKKIFLGIFMPVPILFYILEYFVGLGIAFKAFFWMQKELKQSKQASINAESVNNFSADSNS